jgi:dihydroorotase
MSDLLIRGGRVVDPTQGLDEIRDVLIRDGEIAEIGTDLDGVSIDTLDASGMIVAPGFIDLHTHLREPGQEHKETIRTGTSAAVRGGYTAVCAMANTIPPNDERAVTEMIVAEAQRQGFCHVYPIGAVSKGLQGEALAELADLKSAGCVAFSDDGMPVANSELMRRALEYSRMLDLPIVVHEEDPLLSAGGVMHEGFYSTLLGLGGMPAAAEETMTWRDMLLVGMTGGRMHVAHISTRGAVEAVRAAKARGLAVTAEVTPHHIALEDGQLVSYSTSLKMKPPLRSKEHVEAVIQAVVDGTIDVIATDHAPHHPDEKDVEFDLAPFGIIGLETAFAVSCEVLYHGGHIDLRRLIDLFSCGPARVFSLPGGSLETGGPGDVTIVDPDGVVRFDAFVSKSSNSPFAGRDFRGRVIATIVGGNVRFEDEDALAVAGGASGDGDDPESSKR